MFKNLKSGGVFKHFLLATTFVTSISFAELSNLSASVTASASSAGSGMDLAAMGKFLRSLPPTRSAAEADASLDSGSGQRDLLIFALNIAEGVGLDIKIKSIECVITDLAKERHRLGGEVKTTKKALREAAARLAALAGSPSRSSVGTASPARSVTSVDSRCSRDGEDVAESADAEGLRAERKKAEKAMKHLGTGSGVGAAAATLRVERDRALAESERLGQDLHTAQDKLAEVNAALDALRTQTHESAETMQSRIDDLTASNDAKAIELKELQGKIAVLEAAKERLEASATTTAGEIDVLRAETTKAHQRIAELTARDTAKASTIEELTRQLEEIQAAKRTLEEASQHDNESHKAALELAQKAAAEAEKTLAQKSAEFEEQAALIAADLEAARASAVTAETKHAVDIRAAKEELLSEKREGTRRALAEAQEAHARELAEAEARLSSRSSQALARQNNELSAAHDARVREIQEEAQQKLTALESAHAESLAKAAQDGGGAITEALATQKASLEAVHARAFARIQNESSLALAAANKANVQALSDLKHRLDSEKEAALTALSQEHSLHIAQIRSEFAAEKDALERTTEDKIEAAKQELSKRLETATGSAEDQLVPLRAEIEEARKDLKRTQMEARSLTARLRALASERDALKGATTQLAADIEAVKSKHTAEMTSEREAARRNEQEAAQKLTEQKEHHAKECEDLEAKNAALKAQVGDAREAKELETHRAQAFQNSLGDAEDGISTIADVAGVLVPTTDDAGSPAEDWVPHVVGNLRSLLERILPDYGTARAHAGVNEGDLLAVAVEGLVRDQTDARDAAARLRSRLGGEGESLLSSLAERALTRLTASEDTAARLQEQSTRVHEVLEEYAEETDSLEARATLAVAAVTRFKKARDTLLVTLDEKDAEIAALGARESTSKAREGLLRETILAALPDGDVSEETPVLGLAEALISHVHRQPDLDTLVASSASAAGPGGMGKDGSVQESQRKASRRSNPSASLLEEDEDSNPCCVCFGAKCC